MVGVQVVFCTKNLERTGEHTNNLAEAVHYMVRGGQMRLGERPKDGVIGRQLVDS